MKRNVYGYGPLLPEFSGDFRLKRVAAVCPAEGFRHRLVEVRDEPLDPLAQIRHRLETTSLQHPAYQDAEPNLNLVHPRRVARRVHKPDAMTRVFQECLSRLFRFQYTRSTFFPNVVSSIPSSRATSRTKLSDQ